MNASPRLVSSLLAGVLLGLLLVPAPGAVAAGPAPPHRRSTPKAPTILNTIDLPRAVELSPYVFEARVLATDPEWKTARRTGQRYLASWRLQVEVVRAFRGGEELTRYAVKTGPFWLRKRNPPPWRKLSDVYPSDYALDRAQPGDTFIAFCTSLEQVPGVDDRPTVELRYADHARVADQLAALAARADRKMRERWRRQSPCQADLTFFYEGRCQPRDALVAAWVCPPGATVAQRLEGREPRLWCARADGTEDGLTAAWGRDGRLREVGVVRAGAREGTWNFYGDDGVRRETRTYAAGVLAGPYTRWHPNGKPAMEGAYADGHPVGVWVQRDPRGKVIGRSKLGAGTGTLRRWFRRGRLAEETTYREGLRLGPYRRYTESGRRAVVGQYLADQKVGLWLFYDAKGRIASARCFRAGALAWETEDREVIRHSECKP